MKFRTLVITLLFAAGAVSSVAVAKGPPPGKGKNDANGPATSATTTTTKDKEKGKHGSAGESCKPSVAVVLKGTFVSGGSGSFVMDVTKANKHGHKYVGEKTTVSVDHKTRIRRNGPAKLEDFEEGDRLNVQARTCKQKKHDDDEDGEEGESSTSAQGGSSSAAEDQKLLARRVVGHPAKKKDSESESD